MRKFLTLIFFLLAVLIYSCEKDTGPLIVEPVVTNPPPRGYISYANDVQPIFNANCVHCHTQVHPFLNLLSCCSWQQLVHSGASAPYVDTLSPSESYLYIRITEDGILPRMPLGGPYLMPADIDIIYKWIQEGAKNN